MGVIRTQSCKKCKKFSGETKETECHIVNEKTKTLFDMETKKNKNKTFKNCSFL